MTYELIIIGAGPAGITASVYAARKRMNFLVISQDIGGQTAWSGDVENYTGYQFITGPELAMKFEEHMHKYNVEVREGEKTIELKKLNDIAEIKTDKDSFECKTVIVASGKRSRELGVPGETQFKNRGITYCATCDGPLFAGKDVAVIGGGNSALDAVLQLIQIARLIYVINITDQFTGDAVMQEKVRASEKVKIMHNVQVAEVLGDKVVKAIKIKSRNKEQTLSVQGVFVEIGLVPNSEFASQLNKNESGEIIVDCQAKTNIPGIFAAGDVTNVPDKQIIIAAGDGAKAALGAFRYLAQKK